MFIFHYIWSDYGDEIVVDKGTKLSKWTPVGRVSQKLNFIKDRGLYKKKERKKSHRRKYKSPPKSEDGGTGGEEAKSEKKLLSKESQARLNLEVSEIALMQKINFRDECEMHEKMILASKAYYLAK